MEPRNPEFRALTLCAKGEGHIACRVFASGARARRGRGNPCTPANSLRENRETSATLCRPAAGRWGKVAARFLGAGTVWLS